MAAVSGKGICTEGEGRFAQKEQDTFADGKVKCAVVAWIHGLRYSGRLAVLQEWSWWGKGSLP